MTIDEQGDRRSNGIEKELARLVPKGGPPGLRQRVVGRAREAGKNTLLTPRLRAAAVACLVLIVALLGAEPFMRRSELGRMAALLGARDVVPAAGAEATELAEIIGTRGREAGLMGQARFLALASDRGDRERSIIDAKERLKGWLENEVPEDLN
jgi:hypothetical protein